jgi:uroporphyrinogen decarboxylase
MRQAGRSLPEYRALREGTAMLDTCFRSDMVAEITMQPVRRYGVDAAILFSDIVVPLRAVGVDVEIVAGVGPVVAHPIRNRADLDQLRSLDESDVASVLDAVDGLTGAGGELGATPLIGFAGAPFTLASYLVEGGPSRDHVHTKALMHSDPQLWSELCARLADIAGEFLRLQVMHGASAVQLFDSWAGALSRRDYERHVLPHSRACFDRVGDLGVPMIHFGVGTGELLGSMSSAGCDVVGVDFRVDLADAITRLGTDFAVQGNLDPALLFASSDALDHAVRRVLESGREAKGHIFNLGHGVLPETNPDALARVVELVHAARVD